MPRRSEMMRQDIQLEFAQTMQTLKDVWDEIGFSDEQINKRGEKVIQHVRGLFNEMVSEETILKTKLLSTIQEQKSGIECLSDELSLPIFKPDNDGLIQQEKMLRSHLNKLTTIKNERLAELASLQEVEKGLCDQLYVTPYYIQSGSTPSEQQLNEVKEHIETLTAEKQRREELISSQRSQILQLYNELGRTPNTSFSQEFIEEDILFFLTSEKMDQVKRLLENLMFSRSEAQIKVEGLWQLINALWQRLDIDDETCQKVRIDYQGIQQRDIEGLGKVLDELEILKLENMQKLTESLRTDISNYWEKCFYSAEQRQLFTPAYMDNFTQDLLDAHENELNKLIEYYNKHKVMFTSVNKWQTLFNRMKELEEKQRNPDPNRYNNRGGQLLAEERERKKTQQQLPKIEQQLLESVEKWETEMNEPFLVNGERFTDYVCSQWEDYRCEKESEKQERMMKKQKEIQNEMTFGSTPKTPKKRPHGMPPRTPLTGKKKCIGNTTTTCRTPAGALTPSNRTNLMYSTRVSPGRTPISFRVKPGATLKYGSEKKKAGTGSAVKKRPAGADNRAPGKKVHKKEPTSSSTTMTSSVAPSIRSAPPGAGDPNSTFSVTVISEDPSTRTAPTVDVHNSMLYDDFAAEITKSGSKVVRSSAIGDGRYHL